MARRSTKQRKAAARRDEAVKIMFFRRFADSDTFRTLMLAVRTKQVKAWFEDAKKGWRWFGKGFEITPRR